MGSLRPNKTERTFKLDYTRPQAIACGFLFALFKKS
nr:MAG TPA: hypothetical protein [Caudoviricetes sp.]